jgi:UDP-2,3-diacylglucosamine pyrophosphatase LpxH
LSLAKEGTNVYYITGNHDDFLRDWSGFGLSFGDIKVYDEVIHETPDGKRYLVIHGDMFDKLVDTGPISKFFGFIGSLLYHLAFNISMLVNFLFRPFKVHRWSLSATVKKLLRIDLLPFLTDYEKRMVEYVKRRECIGIICGHIHRPDIREIGDITYMNDGDWVSSKSAVVENHDGTFELIRH